MRFLKIVGLGVLAAIGYGIVHDQVTVRVCVEYFTVAHPPPVVPIESPSLLAVYWGIVATWWVGLPLGLLLALAARAGRRPKLAAKDLVRPILILLAVMGALALAAGVTGGLLARAGRVWLVGWFAEVIPPERHARFLADLWAHNASYAVGALGGVVLAVLTFRRRRRIADSAVPDRDPPVV